MLVSWFCVPALMLAVFWGCGLLVRRAGGNALPGTLVLPLGFATVVLTSGFLTSWDGTAELAGPAFVLLAIAGFICERSRLLAWIRRPKGDVWPLLAAAVPFAVFAAPVVLSGHPGWTGYARIVDIAHQFDYSAYLVTEGRAVPRVVDSSFLEMANKTLGIGYPGGWQGTVGSFSSLSGVDLAWIYQPLLGLTAAMGALSIYALLGPLVASRPLRALAGAIAAQANVVYAYGSTGGFKELSAAVLVLLVAAVIGELRPAEDPVRRVVPAAVAVAACFASFSLTVVPWLGVILAGYGVLTLGRDRTAWPRIVRTWLAFGVVAALLALPTIIQATKLAKVAGQAEGSGATVLVDLGNLAAPMPVEAVAGVWLTGDYRLTTTGSGGLTTVLIVIVVALSVLGVAFAVSRRQWRVPLLAASATLAVLYFVERTGPWIELKAISISNPIPLVCAFAGAAALVAARSRFGVAAAVAGWALALAVAGGVLYGNALAYHEAALAPYDRMHDLERLGDRLAGRGPTLYPAHEEYAEYFLRDAKTTSMVNPPPPYFFKVRPKAVAARGPAQPFAWDVDELEPEFLQGFRLLVRRRSPVASRPPSTWSLVARTPWHEVWQQRGDPARILLHEPLERFEGTRRSICATVARAAARAPRGSEIIYATLPDVVTFNIQHTRHPTGWPVDRPGSLMLTTPGIATGHVRLTRTGTWQLWLAGSISRELDVQVDGRPVGSIKDQRNYPEQWEHVGGVRLDAGRHSIRFIRGGGNLEPGNGGGNTAGPLAFERPTHDAGRLRRAPLGDARSVCEHGNPDWVEVVAPA